MNAEKKEMQTVTENVTQPIEVMKYEKSDLPENDLLVCFSCLNPTLLGCTLIHQKEIITWVDEPKRGVLDFSFYFLFEVQK